MRGIELVYLASPGWFCPGRVPRPRIVTPGPDTGPATPRCPLPGWVTSSTRTGRCGPLHQERGRRHPTLRRSPIVFRETFWSPISMRFSEDFEIPSFEANCTCGVSLSSRSRRPSNAFKLLIAHTFQTERIIPANRSHMGKSSGAAGRAPRAVIAIIARHRFRFRNVRGIGQHAVAMVWRSGYSVATMEEKSSGRAGCGGEKSIPGASGPIGLTAAAIAGRATEAGALPGSPMGSPAATPEPGNSRSS